MSGKLAGKVAFITGGARGQGRAHAVRLAREGADIITVDICKQVDGVRTPMSTPEDLQETVRLVEELDRGIHAVEADVRDFARLSAVVDEGVQRFGRLDIVVGNAGIGATGAPLHEMTEHTWQTTVDINQTGVWLTAKAAVPHIIAGGRGGAIVLTSSIGGVRANPNIGHYTAAKHAVIGIMRTLAVELAQHHIRCNAVLPTQANTPMCMNDWTYRMFRPDLENPTQQDFAPVSQLMHVLPEPWVEPEDIANAVAFLVSDDARFITGVELPVDLGALLK
jgi:(+)-trans-carveol dehydrogenase